MVICGEQCDDKESSAPGQRQSVTAEVDIHSKEEPERRYHKIQSSFSSTRLLSDLGVDYTDTYSLVAKFVSICIILALSVQLGLITHTMDVDTAFFNASLDEIIWV
jgi:Reverse transcriptase (RNA-dependent DNA polymerase)